MLRILQPGLLCFAPLVLASPAIGTRALKARGRAAQGGRSERREDLEPWEEAGVYESPEGVKQAAAPLQHQAHLWCSQYEGNSRERRSPAGFFAAETAALPGAGTQGSGCRAPLVLASPAIGEMRHNCARVHPSPHRMPDLVWKGFRKKALEDTPRQSTGLCCFARWIPGAWQGFHLVCRR